jgi:hypothetical protein
MVFFRSMVCRARRQYLGTVIAAWTAIAHGYVRAVCRYSRRSVCLA